MQTEPRGARKEPIARWRRSAASRSGCRRNSPKGGIPGFVHLYAGQEASAVGVCTDLAREDYIASTHRGHGHSIAKGCDVSGDDGGDCSASRTGCAGARAARCTSPTWTRACWAPTASSAAAPPLVVGAALTAKTLGTGTVAVSFTGDGGSNQGTVFEAMNLAVVLQLPAIFVFENNGYGEVHRRVLRGRQPRHRRPRRAASACRR